MRAGDHLHEESFGILELYSLCSDPVQSAPVETPSRVNHALGDWLALT